MYSSAYVWAKVLSWMEDRLGSVTVSAWFDDAEVVELNEEQLIIYSSNDFRREITLISLPASKSANAVMVTHISARCRLTYCPR